MRHNIKSEWPQFSIPLQNLYVMQIHGVYETNFSIALIIKIFMRVNKKQLSQDGA